MELREAIALSRIVASKALCDVWVTLRHPRWRTRLASHEPGSKARALGDVRLVVFDVDGTLVRSRNSWGRVTRQFPGRAPRARALFARHVAGDLSYAELCAAVVRLWQPPPRREFFEELGRSFVLRDGASELVAALRRARIELAVVSTGLDLLVTPVARALGIERVFANRLRFDARQRLRAVEVEVTPQGKRVVLEALSGELAVPRRCVLYVGDSREDLAAVEWAGVGVFFDNVNREKGSADLLIRTLRDLQRLLTHQVRR